jgi:hypothetical protein
VIGNHGRCTGGSVFVEVIRTDADAYERAALRARPGCCELANCGRIRCI